MSINKEENTPKIPEEQHPPIVTQTFTRQERSVPSLQTITEIHQINARNSKSKPKGILLTQAAEIKKLNQSLSEYKQRYQTLSRQKMDRQNYQSVIKELQDSDNSKKNEIQKLSLTIRSLISSCEAYRKQIGSINQKIRKVEDYNSDLIKKYETIDKQNQTLKQQYDLLKMQSKKQLEALNLQLSRNQGYLESVQKNVDNLMKRVNEIPGFERQILHLKGQNDFWRDETERLSNQLKIMDELYIECCRKRKEVEVTVSKLTEKVAQRDSTIKDYESRFKVLQEENISLNEKIQQNEMSLTSKHEEYQIQLKSVQEHKSQKDLLSQQIVDKDNEIKQKNKLILSLERQITKLSEQQTGYQQFKNNYKSEVARLSKLKESQEKMFNTLLQEKKHNQSNLIFLLEQRERQTMGLKKKIEGLEADMIKISSELHFTEADKNIYLKQLNKYKEKDQTNEDTIKRLNDDLKIQNIELQSKLQSIEGIQTKIQQQKDRNNKLYNDFTKVSEEKQKKDQQILILSSKVSALDQTVVTLKEKLNQQSLKNKNLSELSVAKYKQLLMRQKAIEEELKTKDNQATKLKKQNEQLQHMIGNKIDESEKIKKKMIQIEAQLLQQFEDNLQKSNKHHQNSIKEIQQQKHNLQQIVLYHHESQKRFQNYLEEDGIETQSQQLELRGGKDNGDYKQRAKKIEEKLKEFRDVKKELTKLKASLDQTLVEKEKLKQYVKKQEEIAKSTMVKASALEEQKNKIIAQRNQISLLLQNKSEQCQKLKIKLLTLEEELKDFFEDSYQTQLRSHQDEIRKLQEEKESQKGQLEIIIKSLKEIEISSKENHEKAYKQLENKSVILEKELKSASEQKEEYKNANIQLNKNAEEGIFKLMAQLQRLQARLTKSQENRKNDLENYKTQKQSLEQKVASLIDAKNNNEELYSKLLIKATQEGKKRESYEGVLTKIQNEFITLQLLVGELKKERNLLMRKMSFMIKGIHSTNEQLDRLNSEADRLANSFQPNSPLHQDIAKHIEIIQEAFSSLQNFKVEIIEYTETPEERHRC